MSTKEDRLLAGRQLFIRAVLDDARRADAEAREVVEPRLEPGETIAGELPDGTRIGTVRRNRASRRPVVTDARALLDWVAEHRPDEVVRSVRSSFVTALERSCREHGVPVDKTTGEVIPGMEMAAGSASYKPTVDEAVVPMLRAKYAELIAAGLLALPGASPVEWVDVPVLQFPNRIDIPRSTA